MKKSQSCTVSWLVPRIINFEIHNQAPMLIFETGGQTSLPHVPSISVSLLFFSFFFHSHPRVSILHSLLFVYNDIFSPVNLLWSPWLIFAFFSPLSLSKCIYVPLGLLLPGIYLCSSVLLLYGVNLYEAYIPRMAYTPRYRSILHAKLYPAPPEQAQLE